MKAIRQYGYGDPKSLHFEDATKPQPKEGEILVRVHAAGVTPTELQWASSSKTQFGTARQLPFIPGHEFSGEAVALGADVTSINLGEAVYGMIDWYRDGAQAEYCLARVADVASKPVSVDHAHAAVIPISALTAWQGLFERGQITAGQHVLIHGAAGSVGSFAVQLAKWRGAQVTVTARAANADFLRSLGADAVIDYQTERFQDRVQEMDVVFDTVGGDTLQRSWDVLKPNGRMVTIAGSVEASSDKRTRSAFFIVEPRRVELQEITRLIDAGHLIPIVAAEFRLSDASRAYRTKALRGKVVLRVRDW